jgi:hypothetical protein
VVELAETAETASAAQAPPGHVVGGRASVLGFFGAFFPGFALGALSRGAVLPLNREINLLAVYAEALRRLNAQFYLAPVQFENLHFNIIAKDDALAFSTCQN